MNEDEEIPHQQQQQHESSTAVSVEQDSQLTKEPTDTAHRSDTVDRDDVDNVEAVSSDESDDFAEEDAWLLAGHFLEEDDDENENQRASDPEQYVAQLMDAREMLELRSSLRKTERQIETCGRMREFVPRKPAPPPSPECRNARRAIAASPPSQHRERSIRPGVVNNTFDRAFDGEGGDCRHLELTSSGPTRAFLTAAPSTDAILAPIPGTSRKKKKDYDLVLQRELRQLRGGYSGLPMCITSYANDMRRRHSQIWSCCTRTRSAHCSRCVRADFPLKRVRM